MPMLSAANWEAERPNSTPRRVNRENFTGTSSVPVVVSSVCVPIGVHSFPLWGGLVVSLPAGGPDGVFGGGVRGGGACGDGPLPLLALGFWLAPSAAASACPPACLPAFGPAAAAFFATSAPTTTAAAGPAPAAALLPPAAADDPLAPAPVPALPPPGGGGLPPPPPPPGGGGFPPPPPPPPGGFPPPPSSSRTFLGSPPEGLDGIGTGRFIAFFDSCSAPIVL